MTLKTDPSAPDADVETEQAADEPEPERPLLCAACRAPITDRAERREVHGAHEHRRVNPSGVDFHVGCFGRAPGAAAEGEATTYWTWFPGYAWSMALCRACGAHLGWRFSGPDTFWGLILPRLVEGS